MGNDQFHEKANVNCTKSNEDLDADPEGGKEPFGEQSIVDPLFSSLIDSHLNTGARNYCLLHDTRRNFSVTRTAWKGNSRTRLPTRKK